MYANALWVVLMRTLNFIGRLRQTRLRGTTAHHPHSANTLYGCLAACFEDLYDNSTFVLISSYHGGGGGGGVVRSVENAGNPCGLSSIRLRLVLHCSLSVLTTSVVLPCLIGAE